MNQNDLQLGARELGIDLTQRQLQQFEVFTTMIVEVNAVMNLTRVPEADFVSRHFLDSFLVSPWLRDKNISSVVDIGSGAGFPGIPLGIAFPQIEFLLVDALQKRVRFLEHVITDLSLKNVKAIHGRSEELTSKNANMKASFDVAVSRAVAAWPKLLPWMTPWVKKGGVVLAIKGPNVQGEIQDYKNIVLHPAPACSYISQPSIIVEYKG